MPGPDFGASVCRFALIDGHGLGDVRLDNKLGNIPAAGEDHHVRCGVRAVVQVLLEVCERLIEPIRIWSLYMIRA